MNRQIYVNLPVNDLERSNTFFATLGFAISPQFSDATTTCVVVADDIYVMLLTENKFKAFTPKSICDTRESTEVLLCLSCASRAEVDELVSKAVAAGGTTYNDAQDHGFMYGHGFQDLDGHIWELVYMEAVPPKQS